MGVVSLPPGYTVREFRVEDADAFPGHRESLVRLGLDADRYLALLAEGGCFTVLKDGVPVGAAGVLLQPEEPAMAWFLASEDVRRRPKLHFAIARQFLEVAHREYALPEIHATVAVGEAPAERLVRHLGFTRVGPTTVHGQPHTLYRRARE